MIYLLLCLNLETGLEYPSVKFKDYAVIIQKLKSIESPNIRCWVRTETHAQDDERERGE